MPTLFARVSHVRGDRMTREMGLRRQRARAGWWAEGGRFFGRFVWGIFGFAGACVCVVAANTIRVRRRRHTLERTLVRIDACRMRIVGE